jgi:hypothetical protein
MIAVLLGFVALVLCYSRGYILLYGDAVAHLGTARRILDSRNPGLSQLGGVWLPLPHLLMLPFVQKLQWWQDGLAGAWPSVLCFVAGVAGFYRLCRRLLVPRWAVAATMFYALNPNLLYLSTTAMTEPLFLALLIWLVLITLECGDALRGGNTKGAGGRLVLLGVLIFAAVLTRYDGWVLGAAIWCVMAWQVLHSRDRNRLLAPYVLFTVLTVAGPLLWLGYNQLFFHDPLDFMRGPYSAAAIEKKTTPPGAPHYRGWHNPGWSLIFYTRTAQVDAAAWETGFALMAAALAGLYLTARRSFAEARWTTILLWLPLPFYLYSVSYGSVPIFIPQLYPHSYYNSRYGMEMLPALVLFGFLAFAALERRLVKRWPMAVQVLSPLALVLAVVNCAVMSSKTPLVLKEGLVNASTRMSFESGIARQLESFPAGSSILMYNSDHIGALQQAGIPLRQTLNEGDRDSFEAALAAPADKAMYVVAIAGDPVAKAVEAHPDGLTELTVLCTTGQSCARIYKSDRYGLVHTLHKP